jgi:YesN/AraC family two-component response regulator
MDAKALKDITSELTLLYIEDDDNLRTETAKLFGHLFKTVETAENGKIGLDKLNHCDFDLVITDINMPLMDGVTLSRKIRQSNQKQTIIVTSAHDESNYLLELINIGIDRFILKPLDMKKMIYTLFSVCTNISNEKLIQKYKQEIEATNMRLKDSNDELKSLLQTFDMKIS